MAICSWCDQDMMVANSCSLNTKVDFGNEVMDPVPFKTQGWDGPHDRCSDCNVVVGGIHHPGCCSERCPKCGGQLISCGCLDPEEEADGN
jgi:hypothetical protein